MAETATLPRPPHSPDAPDTGTHGPEAPPTDEERAEQLLKELKIQLVDVSDSVVSHAADAADEYIRQRTETPDAEQRGFFRNLAHRLRPDRLVRNIWYGNVAREFVRDRERRQARNQMLEEENIYARQGGTKAEHESAMSSVVGRFTSEYNLLHDRETNGELGATAEGAQLEGSLKDLVKSYADSDMTNASLKAEADRLLRDYGRQRREQGREGRDTGLIYAHNMVKVAENARAALRHGAGLAAIDEALARDEQKAQIGAARTGVRTESTRSGVDRVLDRLESIPGVNLLNETTLSVIAAGAVTVGKIATRKGLAIAGTATMGAVAGVAAGVREAHRVKQERRLHGRQMAEGGEIGDQSRRRQQMEGTRYETTAAHDLMAAIDAAHARDDGDAAGRFEQLLQATTEAGVRITMSDRRNVDFISFSSKTNVEEERFALDVKLAEAEVELQRVLDSADDATLQAIGTNRETTAQELLTLRSDAVRSTLEADVSLKDQAFSRLRRNRVATAAVVGAALGVTLGAGGEEIHAALSHTVGDHLQGLLQDADRLTSRRTELASIFRENHVQEVSAAAGVVHHPDAKFDQSAFKVGNDAVDLPKGYHIVTGAHGAHELVDGQRHVVAPNVQFDGNGHLDAATAHLLEQKGFHMHVTTEEVPPVIETQDVVRSPQEYIGAHPEQFTSVGDRMWFDDNSPNHPIGNALRLDWGGQSGSGVDGQGNYVFNVSRMTAEGSFHGGEHANVQELIANHNLKMAFSIDRGSQDQVILVPIDSNGNAVIDPHSPPFNSLFQVENGQARFIGGYAEVVQTAGTDAQGNNIMNVFATVAGENHPAPIHESIQQVVQPGSEHVITHLEAPVVHEGELPVEVTPVLPIVPRGGMERLRRREQDQGIRNPNLLPTYYGGHSLEELQQWIAEDPSRLKTRRFLTHPDGRQEWVESDGSPVRRDVQRERDLITAYLERQRQGNPNHYQMVERTADALGAMQNANRVSVNVPAWMEGGGLRHFLEEYTAQVDGSGAPLAPELYEINVLVNRKTGSEPDDSVSVINAFIRDFEARHGFRPPVNYHNIELDPPYNNVGYARKLLTDAVMLRDIRRDGQTEPLYLETEDADMIHIDPRTVNNLITKFDQNPQFDALRGVMDRAPEYLKENDLLFLSRRVFEFMEIMTSTRRFRDPTHPNWNFRFNRRFTNGWNTGITAEAYALIDGYDIVPIGEDASVGERLTMVRGDGNLPNLEVVGKVYSRSDASPRRFIHELRTGQPAYATENFVDEEINADIRENTIEAALDSINHYARINDSNVDVFNNYIGNIYLWVKNVTPTERDAEQVTRRVLFWLGFKRDDYQLVGDAVQITNWDNAKNALESYRQRYATTPSPA